LISTGIGVLGASAIVSLLAGTALISLLILMAAKRSKVELVSGEESEEVLFFH
jgi:hypothetical protein